VTFDFFLYLVNAEIERIKRGFDFLKLHIILPLDGSDELMNIDDSTFRNGEHANIHYILDRISGIIEPLCRCHPKVLSVAQFSKDEFEFYKANFQPGTVFPEDYQDGRTKQYYYANIEDDLRQHLHEIQGFITATQSAHQVVSRFLEECSLGRKVVVVTLREYDFQYHRNSKSQDWTRFIDGLDSQLYFVVIVRDTYKVYTPFQDSNGHIFNEASLDLKIRAALYQQAYLNLSVNCGPSSLFYFLKNCHSIEFRDINPESLSTTAEQMYKASLMVQGEQPFYAHPRRNLVFWGDDSYLNIQTAFELFEANLQTEEVFG
jgi:hypothetical protein